MAYPAPVPGELTLYLVGEGVGESVVMRLPNGETVVIDSAGAATLALLGDLAITQIDHLIVTHPDMDHVDRLDEVIDRWPPQRVWTYPIGLVRDFLARWGGQSKGVNALRKAHDRLHQLRTENKHYEVALGHLGKDWAAELRVDVLAPVPADLAATSEQLNKMVTWQQGSPRLAKATVDRLLGNRKTGDRANFVSLALAVSWGPFPWGSWNLLLGGDVEATGGFRGWSGILSELELEQRTHLVEDLDIIKVAHHGSSGAWLDAAWDRHARTRPVKAALIAPFSRGNVPLPTDDVLTRLRSRAARLAISSASADARAQAARWSPLPSTAGENVIVVRLRANGTHEIEAFGHAKHYEQLPPVATPSPPAATLTPTTAPSP